MVFLLLDSAGSFIYGADILLRSLTGLIGEPAQVGGRLGIFLIVMDTFLVGATLMIAAFGFYELFVIRSERSGQRFWLPSWLKMRDLEDLKARIVSMLILVAAITFVDVTVESHDEQGIFYMGLGISIIIVALTAFLRFGRQLRLSAPPGETLAASSASPATPPSGQQAGPPGRPADQAARQPAPPQAEQRTPPPAGQSTESRAEQPGTLPTGSRLSGRTTGRAAWPTGTAPERAKILALLGSSKRDGSWNAALVTDVIATAGWARLDLRHAVLPGRRIRIRLIALLGAVWITVPPEMEVADSGLTLLGNRSVCGGSAQPTEGGAPVLVISGLCVVGSLHVRRKPRKP